MNERSIRWATAGMLVAVLAIGLSLSAAGCQALQSQNSQPLTERDLILGPYVTAVSPDSAQVHWISPASVRGGSCRLSDDDSGAVVKVGTSAITGREDVRYTATITGLAPDRRYWYEVTSGGEQAEGSFRTPPAFDSDEVKE